MTRCPNRRGCPAQVAQRVIHFVSRRAMDIQWLGDKHVLQLMEQGLIKDAGRPVLPDQRPDLLPLERMGDKLADNILAAIAGSKHPPLTRLIFALGIRLVGEHAAEILARQFGSLEKLQAATVDELDAVHGIGKTMAESIVAFFGQPETTELLDKLTRAGVAPDHRHLRPDGGHLRRQIVRLHRRPADHEPRRGRGAVSAGSEAAPRSSVSKQTDYVVAGENAGSKLDKARSAGRARADRSRIPAVGRQRRRHAPSNAAL